jgi:hypothetical protein
MGWFIPEVTIVVGGYLILIGLIISIILYFKARKESDLIIRKRKRRNAIFIFLGPIILVSLAWILLVLYSHASNPPCEGSTCTGIINNGISGH